MWFPTRIIRRCRHPRHRLSGNRISVTNNPRRRVDNARTPFENYYSLRRVFIILHLVLYRFKIPIKRPIRFIRVHILDEGVTRPYTGRTYSRAPCPFIVTDLRPKWPKRTFEHIRRMRLSVSVSNRFAGSQFDVASFKFRFEAYRGYSGTETAHEN